MSDRPTRRRIHAVLACLTLGSAFATRPRAQPRPSTLRVVCGYPAGGPVDLVCRKVAEKLGDGRVAAQAVVENKPGAAGRLAVEEICRSAADGSAMLVTPASVVTMYPHVYRQLSYDPFTDLAPVSTVAASGFALALGPKVPDGVQTIADFARWCRAHPDAAQCGNPGAGSMPHFLAMLLERELNVSITHVPYRGGLLAMQAVAAGEVAAALSTETSARALAQAGRLRVAATSGTERSAFLPQALTFREQGLPRLTQREWFGAFMPGRTPPAVVQAMADALRGALAEPDVRETWNRAGLLAESIGPAELRAAMRSEYEFWGPPIRASGFTPES
jgi:tripartite-type tricarboxylate transporter receptor subunit TctC